MKLKSALKRRSISELVKMAQSWGLPEQEMPASEDGREALVAHLYPRMQAKGHFQHLWDQLSEGRQRLVTFLAIHGGDMGLRELARRSFGSETKDARKALAPLIESGLVFRDSDTSSLVGDDIYGVPDLLLRHIDLYEHYQGYLGQFLHDLSSQELERIATEGLGVTPKSNKTDYLRWAVRHALLKPTRLRTHIESLPNEERALFHDILKRGGVCIYSDLIDLGFQRHYDHSKVDLLNHLLRQTGLLFIAAKGANKYADLLMVPKDIAKVVRSGYHEDRRSLSQLDTATAGGRHTPAAVLDNGAQMLRDLVIFASHVQRNGVRRLANGGIGKNDLKKILPTLSPNKTLKYVRFLGLMASELGLLIPVGDRWQLSERFEKWLANPKQAYADIVRLWAKTSAWNEEYVDGDVAHTDLEIAHLLDIAQFRRLVIESLMNLPHGQWVEFRAFADVLLPKVALAVPRRAQRAHGKFNRPPFFIAESIVADSLHWLGLVAVGADSRTNLEAIQSRGNLPVGGPRRKLRQRLKSAEDTHLLFRVTDLGDQTLSFLANGKSDLPDCGPLTFSATKFTVQPNHELLAPPDLDLPIFKELLAHCEIRSVDVMATLVLSRDSVRHGLEHGSQPDRLMALLRAGSAAPLPQTIEALIEECSRRQSSLFIGATGGSLVVDDPVIMAEIGAHRKLKPMIREVIDNRVILFHPHADLARVAQEIEKIGYTVDCDSAASVPTDAGKLSLALSERDLSIVVAALKFTAVLEEEMGIDLSENRLRSVIKKIQPGGARFHALQDYADTMSKKFIRRHGQALRRTVEQATERYRQRVAKLVDSAPSRTSGRFAYTGPNPATADEDIRAMMEYAIENEIAVQVKHSKSNQEKLDEELRPESIEGDRLYAFSSARDTHSLLRFDRIAEARLL